MAKLNDFIGKPADWDALFPVKNKDPEPNTFVLGLVLGGTVSAAKVEQQLHSCPTIMLECQRQREASDI